MWDLDYKGWALKNWCFWIVVLEKTLDSPLDSKVIKPVNPNGNQSWTFTEWMMLKLKLQYFGHLMWRVDSLKRTLMLEKIESPLDCKEIQPLDLLKEISPGCSLEGMMLKLKLPILWPLHAKGWLTGKDPDPGRDWGQEEKGTTEDEMAGWHHWLDGHEFEWIPGVGDGQGGLACCSPWGCRVRHNWATELNWVYIIAVSRPRTEMIPAPGCM